MLKVLGETLAWLKRMANLSFTLKEEDLVLQVPKYTFLPAFPWICIVQVKQALCICSTVKESYSFPPKHCLLSPLENRLGIVPSENNTKLPGFVLSNLRLA